MFSPHCAYLGSGACPAHLFNKVTVGRRLLATRYKQRRTRNLTRSFLFTFSNTVVRHDPGADRLGEDSVALGEQRRGVQRGGEQPLELPGRHRRHPGLRRLNTARGRS